MIRVAIWLLAFELFYMLFIMPFTVRIYGPWLFEWSQRMTLELAEMLR